MTAPNETPTPMLEACPKCGSEQIARKADLAFRRYDCGSYISPSGVFSGTPVCETKVERNTQRTRAEAVERIRQSLTMERDDALKLQIEEAVRADKAEAACAEMRESIGKILSDAGCQGDHVESWCGEAYTEKEDWCDLCRISVILTKNNIGTGWHSPDEWNQLVEMNNQGASNITKSMHEIDAKNARIAELEQQAETYHQETLRWSESVNRLEQQLAEARKDSERKLVLLERICGYLETVRLDRLDETGEFALQTVDWCNGLLEFVEEFNNTKGDK